MRGDRPTLVDLFCGAGGLSLGFTQAGFRPVYAADFDPFACATYAMNLGHHVENVDLKELRVKDFRARVLQRHGTPDVVAGGPPCQGFSIQRRGSRDDARNDLVAKFAELAASLEPRVIVMENVPTLLGSRGTEYLEQAVGIWKKAGYSVISQILNASDYGVPQVRRRAFVVAVCETIKGDFAFPEKTHANNRMTVREALAGLPEPRADFSDHPSFANHKRVKISQTNIERIKHVPTGGGRLDIPTNLQLPCHRNANDHRHLDVFGRMSWSEPAPTLTAMFDNFTRGRFAHPTQHRNITAREGARLQSFPDTFVFDGPKKDVARQIGNAVPPKLAAAIAHQLLLLLSESQGARSVRKRVAS